MPRGCTYQDFIDCGPVRFDGQGGALAYLEWIARIEVTIRLSECKSNQRVRYVSRTLKGTALTWWKEIVCSRGQDTAMSMSWDDFKLLSKEKFYPESERLRMENELRSHKMIGSDHTSYTKRFRELSRLVPHLVTPVSKKIERYIQGLSPRVQGLVASMQHITLDSAITATKVMMDGLEANAGPEENKRSRGETYHHGETYGSNSHDRTWRHGVGFSSRCAKCTLRHQEAALCPNCYRCNRLGHLANGCREETRLEAPVRVRDPTINLLACFECGDQDHSRLACPWLNGTTNQGANGHNKPIWGWTHVTEPDGSQRQIPILDMVDDFANVRTDI